MARYTGPLTKKSRRLGVDLVGGHVLEGSVTQDSRIVDEDVHRPGRLGRLGQR